MQLYNVYEQSSQVQEGYGMYWAHQVMPMQMAMPAPMPMPPIEENKARILCEFPVGRIKIRIRVGTIFHIFKKHWKDFQHATGGALDWKTLEMNVSRHIQEMILNSTHLFFTDELVTREDSLLMYLRRPGDVMFHRIAIAQDPVEKHVYNISTAYKLRIEEKEFYGIWKDFMTQNKVFYRSGMNGIFTRASDNPHLANIHHHPEPQPVVENHFVHFVPVTPVSYILVPVHPIEYAPHPQPLHYLPYPPSVHVW